MQTFETEKHNIPEGATHHGVYGCDTDVYFKKDGDTFLRWKHDNWSLSEFVHHNWVKPIPKPEVVEWKNGELLEYKDEDDEWSSDGRYVCFDAFANHHVFYAANMTLYHAGDEQIRKPESPEEKEKRERLEAAYDLYCVGQSANNELAMTFDDFCSDERNITRNYHLAIVDKTNYRKGE